MEDFDAHPIKNTNNKMTEKNLNPLLKFASTKEIIKNIKEGFLDVKIITNSIYSSVALSVSEP